MGKLKSIQFYSDESSQIGKLKLCNFIAMHLLGEKTWTA